MCALTHRAKPYQLALLIKKSLDDLIVTRHSACEATLNNTNIKILIYLFSMLYLQKDILIRLKKCVFYITNKSPVYVYRLPNLVFVCRDLLYLLNRPVCGFAYPIISKKMRRCY